MKVSKNDFSLDLYIFTFSVRNVRADAAFMSQSLWLIAHDSALFRIQRSDFAVTALVPCHFENFERVLRVTTALPKVTNFSF